MASLCLPGGWSQMFWKYVSSGKLEARGGSLGGGSTAGFQATSGGDLGRGGGGGGIDRGGGGSWW